MRRGELLRARWTDVSFETRTMHIPVTKNGSAIPISGKTLALLRSLCDGRDLHSERVLPVTESSAKMAWKRLVKRWASELEISRPAARGNQQVLREGT